LHPHVARLPALRRRTTVTALVIGTHAVFLLLLQTERRAKPERFQSPHPFVSIAIQLHPVIPRDSGPSNEAEAPRELPSAAPAARVIVPTVPPVPAQDAPRDEIPEQSQPVDWYAKAGELAARYAKEAGEPRTFSPPPPVMRQPCVPRRNFDKETRDKMAALMPPQSDPIPVGGFRASSVNMGGVIVRERPLKAREGTDQESGTPAGERSFKWKWEYKDSGGSDLLTLGWEPNPPYDGMFDDMQAGRTPESSVPHHETCD
jgi:hypothetical protein